MISSTEQPVFIPDTFNPDGNFGMAFGPLRPYSIPYRLNPNIQGLQAMSYAQPPNSRPGQLGMENGLLNATSIPIDPDNLSNLQTDDPVSVEGCWRLPRTGHTQVDIPLAKMSNAVQYIPYATEDALFSTLEWGTIGAVAGFCLTAASLALMRSTNLLAKSSRKLILALPFAYGILAGGVAGTLGFSASFFHNFYNYRLHMRKTKLEQKRQTGSKGI